ncbi:MAG: hypothetical protein IKL14_00430 [Alphaproteobacteria bacterium]|nr:hypothetical protein [Alphaproteobacteria bacterium]
MRKFLTTGLFSAILGLAVGAPADAALVSRGFLDEALENYATTTALDLKANQSDFTELSDKIGTLPEGITVQGMYEGWTEYGNELPGLYELASDAFKFKNTFPNVSIGALLALGLEKYANDIYSGPVYPLWKLSEEVAKLTFPEGIDVSGVVAHELLGAHQPNSLPKTVTEAIQVLFNCNGSQGSSAACFPYMASNILFGHTLSNTFIDTYKQQFPGLTEYKGLLQLTADIGTLPEGITVQGMYEGWVGRNGLHTLGLQGLELDSFYIYNPENDSPQELREQKGGLLNVLSSLLHDSGYSAFGGELAPFWKLTQSAYKTDELSAKIGTLPSGEFPIFPESEKFFSWLKQPFTYPTSLAELITAIYGDAENRRIGLLPGIIAGFRIDTDGDGITDSTVGTLPNFMLATEAKELATTANTTATAAQTTADSAVEKIGTLPTEYATVGAALTAIKGIAEEAKAAALAAIPDPKAEGSTGKFVLTVDIVGDNATYRWEKIDREGETTTTE